MRCASTPAHCYMRRCDQKDNGDDNLASVVPFLLPHLRALDNHLTLLLPRRIPLAAGIPKVALGRVGLIHPWLALDAIFEPAIGAAHGDVENQVKVLVKRGAVAAGLTPRVHQSRAIGIGGREVALGPKGFVEVRIHDLEEARVDVGEDVLLGPLEAVGVEARAVSGVQSLSLDIASPPSIVVGVRTPVNRRRHDIVATLRIRVIVAPRLHNVDFSRLGPHAIGVVGGQHPDCGPHPVTLGKLGDNFDTAKLNLSSLLGADAGRLDGVDNGSVGGVRHGNAVVPEIRRTFSGFQQIDDVVRIDE